MSQAVALRNGGVELQLLQVLSGVRLGQFRFSEARKYLLQAEQKSRATGDRISGIRVASNLANLYIALGNYDAARDKAEEGLKFAGRVPSVQSDAELNAEAALRVTLGRINSLQGDARNVETNLMIGAEMAEQAGNQRLGANALAELGAWKLTVGDFEGAEAALAAALRGQLLRRDSNISYSYLRLASLRLRQGFPEVALTLSGRAIETAGGTLAPYRIWQERGPILEALGRKSEAVQCYRRAVELARRWRSDAGPSDRTQTILSDGLQSSVYERFVGLAAELAIRDSNQATAWEAFSALEDNRFSALSAAARGDASSPDSIGRQEKLAQLRAVELRLARHDSAVLRLQGDRLRREIDDANTVVLKYVKDRENFSPQNSLIQFKDGLSESQVIFSFALLPSGCYRWAITREGISLQSLGDCRELSRLVGSFRDALESHRDAVALGSALYNRLFSNLPLHAQKRSSWLLSLDNTLWELPFPALVAANEGGRPVYLVERKSLTILPGVWMRRGDARIPVRGRFVGVGDPIYNMADSRRPQKQAALWSFVLSAMAKGPDHADQDAPLNRLVASGAEVGSAASLWRNSGPGHAAVVLTGWAATRDRLTAELAQPVAVVHIAAHVLSSRTKKDQAVIAMSSDRNGAADAMIAADITALRVRGALVVLNGCSSGRGEIHRGSGLFGLTRAWIVAGAGGVIASQWDMPDDAAGLFPVFYQHWLGGEGRLSVAEALRRAQVDMIRSGTWRANPGFWAAYSMTGVAQ